MARKPKGPMRLYSAYMFRDKDPVIDEIRGIAQEFFGTRNLSGAQFQQIADDGGPTAACVKGWLHGKTRRPQNATLEAAGRALGMKRVWVKHK